MFDRKQGTISIMKVTGGDSDRIRIKLRHVDDNRSALFLEATMEDFAKALFGEAERPIAVWTNEAPSYSGPIVSDHESRRR